MSRPRKSVPSYLPHKSSRRARAVWTDPAGSRQFRMLPGPFDTAKSRAAFARLVAELAASPVAAVTHPEPDGVTVNEVLLPTSNTPSNITAGRTGYPPTRCGTSRRRAGSSASRTARPRPSGSGRSR